MFLLNGRQLACDISAFPDPRTSNMSLDLYDASSALLWSLVPSWSGDEVTLLTAGYEMPQRLEREGGLVGRVECMDDSTRWIPLTVFFLSHTFFSVLASLHLLQCLLLLLLPSLLLPSSLLLFSPIHHLIIHLLSPSFLIVFSFSASAGIKQPTKHKKREWDRSNQEATQKQDYAVCRTQIDISMFETTKEQRVSGHLRVGGDGGVSCRLWI
ncbi:hypothetical protein M440DRAFT_84134 [Trichoderma longibrachiatum ATCC 18648]|uniref:Uncharacterized protein n=1 Tax=Trichoderma longibrachiatum ATCC 18648 TaxID=983965 RepID=A0A2T4CIT7_TRILO|nr:hypothetical protein M440DRAFT_84134 [Trichoderma longibrachiatum ATCC 18648]